MQEMLLPALLANQRAKWPSKEKVAPWTLTNSILGVPNKVTRSSQRLTALARLFASFLSSLLKRRMIQGRMNNSDVVSQLVLDGLISALQMIATNYALPLNDLGLDHSFVLDDLTAAAVGNLRRASPTARPGLR